MSYPKQTERDLAGLLADVRPGFSLPAAFYTDPAVFEAEVDCFIGRHWMLAAHESELEGPGSYVRFDMAGAALILVRGQDGEIRAFHNVCRHRGAQLCEARQGQVQRLACRYHAWSFGLDGSLKAWRHMPPGLRKEDYGLTPCAAAIFEGLVFISLSADQPPNFGALTDPVKAYWARYRLADCKVALAETYVVDANWKLGIENNLECYHCLPSHPEYRSLHGFVRADEKVSATAIETYATHYAKVTQRLIEAGLPNARSDIMSVDGQIARARIIALSAGIGTGSADGLPVAPLLGALTERDESTTAGCFGFHSYLSAASDYALMITYVPQDAGCTHVVAKWLVHRDACEGTDYDLGRLRWLWDETTKQDKDLIELNARGVRSRGYRPGPYAELESGTADFVERYVALMQEPRACPSNDRNSYALG